MKQKLLMAAAGLLLLAGCSDDKAKAAPLPALGDKTEQATSDNQEADPQQASRSEKANPKAYRNGIELETSGGLRVSQAYLAYEDGTLVPADNETQIGRPVKLTLVVDEGWTVEDGQVSLGAIERFTTSKGKVIAELGDLFENTPSVDADDASFINLKANVSNPALLEDTDYFLISFRVWDKKGEGAVEGKYKLYVKE